MAGQAEHRSSQRRHGRAMAGRGPEPRRGSVGHRKVGSVAVAAALLLGGCTATGDAPLPTGVVTLPSGPGQVVLLNGPHVVVGDEDGLVAYDIASGEQRWRLDVCPHPAMASPISARVGDLVALSCDETVRLVDLEQAEERWAVRLAGHPVTLRVGLAGVAISYGEKAVAHALTDGERWLLWEPMPNQSNDLSIAVTDDAVLIGQDRAVYAKEPDDSLRWRAEADPSTMGADNGTLVVREPGGDLRTLDLATGEELASTEIPGALSAKAAILDVTPDVVLLAQGSSAATVYAIDRGTGELAWTTDEDRSTRYLAHGAGLVAVRDDEGGCEVRNVLDGTIVMPCPAETTVVTFDEERVAFGRWAGWQTFIVHIRPRPA
jgi:outer membrane protein assembly factor BamB